MSKYDVVVVGAGNGALSAAIALGKAGKRVLVLEKHNLPGGCAGSFRRGRFEFEISLHQLCQMGPKGVGAVRRMMDDYGVDVDWVSIDESFRTINFDRENGYDVTFPVGVDAFVDKMEEYVPGSRPSMENLMEVNRMLTDAIDFIMENGGNPPADVMAEKYSDFLKCATIPTDQMLRELGLPDKAREIYESYWDYLSADSSEMSFAIYSWMVYQYLNNKPYLAKHTSYEILAAMEQKIRDYGGEIRYNTMVKKIDIKDNAVRGVVLADGSYIECDRVMCNVIPTTVFGKMVDPAEVPARAKKMCDVREPKISGFIIYLGLDCPISDLNFTSYDTFIRPTGDTHALYEASNSIYKPRDFFNCCCLSNAIPDCTPEGTSTMSFLLLYTDDVFKDVTEEEYFKIKDRLIDETIDHFQNVTGVNLRDHIEEIDAASPATLARYAGTPQGTVYGYKTSDWDGMFARTMSGETLDYLVKGLRFCGGHGTQMDGYSQSYLSGLEQAGYMLKDIEEGR